MRDTPPNGRRLCVCLVYFGCFSLLSVSAFHFPVIPHCQAGELILETKKELENYKVYGQQAKERERKLSETDIRLTQKEPGIYLLIIGESETRDHMSVYGYSHKTTPWLEAEMRKSGTLLFQNAYSNHTHTVPALTYALTEKNQYNAMKLADAFSVIEIAKAAGYKTYWISNQQRWGVYETPVTQIIISADKQFWCNHGSEENYQTSYYDGDIARYIPDLTDVPHALVVVHLMGCHGSYKDRYPPEYAMETSEDEQVKTYDGAVHYNDTALRVLIEAMSRYSQFKGWLYFSDHGEDPDTHSGHEASRFTWRKARIPLVMHFSDGFISENPEIFETLSSHREKYWTNDLLYDLMLTILGIENAPHREERFDLASPSYDRTKENAMTLHGKKRISEEP
jgi:heptose-I-phosphate ethanolaminephosphotransferase